MTVLYLTGLEISFSGQVNNVLQRSAYSKSLEILKLTLSSHEVIYLSHCKYFS